MTRAPTLRPVRYKEIKLPTDLYFIESQCAERRIKIGIASDVKTRLGTMHVNSPYPLRLLKLVPGAAALEKGLHQRFADDRLTGEWFRRSQELLSVIESMEGITDIDPPKPVVDFSDIGPCWHEFLTRTGRYEGVPLDDEEPIQEESAEDVRMREIAGILDRAITGE